jgi:hypothetical protein
VEKTAAQRTLQGFEKFFETMKNKTIHTGHTNAHQHVVGKKINTSCFILFFYSVY